MSEHAISNNSHGGGMLFAASLAGLDNAASTKTTRTTVLFSRRLALIVPSFPIPQPGRGVSHTIGEPGPPPSALKYDANEGHETARTHERSKCLSVNNLCAETRSWVQMD